MTFFEAHDSEAIRPMLDVSWAPLLGAFSVLFEEHEDEYFIGLCLEGFIRCAVGWCGAGAAAASSAELHSQCAILLWSREGSGARTKE